MVTYPYKIIGRTGLVLAAMLPCVAVWAAPALVSAPVPGFVAPIAQTPVAEYVDDTRGVYIPAHAQLRAKTEPELAAWQVTLASEAGPIANREAALNQLATGEADTSRALSRIANDPGLLAGAPAGQMQLAQNFAQPRRPAPQSLEEMPSLASGGANGGQALPRVDANSAGLAVAPVAGMGLTRTDIRADAGDQIAVSTARPASVDLQNGKVRLNEERITVRRALQRMLDQVGGSAWTVVWDLDDMNASLPDMDISLRAEEPFLKVLNALLARLQTRSGQPLRVIKYDNTQRLVITDRANSTGGKAVGADVPGGAAVTETVLKENRISLHYDEVPLVDALENMVNQAGKGQWRLRMYAGTDQVLKPAHIEEPFGVAIERVLRVFNLRYEVFPGGKLIVVTAGDSFGFRGVQE